MPQKPPLTLTLQRTTPHRGAPVYFFRVGVRSVVRPELIKYGDVPIDASNRDVQNMAGALAEKLCADYQDTLDPDQYAREALPMVRAIRTEIARTSV